MGHTVMTQMLLGERCGVSDQVMAVLNLGVNRSDRPAVTIPGQLNGARSRSVVRGEPTLLAVA